MRFLPIILVCGLFLSSVQAQSAKKRIALNDTVEKRLISVLEASESLGSTMFSRKELKVQTQIEQLRGQIKKAQVTVKTEGMDGQHINRILQTIDQDLSLAKSSQGDVKTKSLQNAFRQIVMLYQSYQIEAPFKVFFCKKDRSVWIQKDKKPQNPFEQDSGCGRLIQ